VFNINCDVGISESVDPLNWILKYGGGGGQDSNLEPYNQVVKVGEGWVDLDPGLLTLCRVAKLVNILLDKTTATGFCRKKLKNSILVTEAAAK
jgi:hypothetical protein